MKKSRPVMLHSAKAAFMFTVMQSTCGHWIDYPLHQKAPILGKSSASLFTQYANIGKNETFHLLGPRH